MNCSLLLLSTRKFRARRVISSQLLTRLWKRIRAIRALTRSSCKPLHPKHRSVREQEHHEQEYPRAAPSLPDPFISSSPSLSTFSLYLPSRSISFIQFTFFSCRILACRAQEASNFLVCSSCANNICWVSMGVVFEGFRLLASDLCWQTGTLASLNVGPFSYVSTFSIL